ncbi:hypothetical protein JOB18_033058 [Solea senegalensis]|uniref:Uncharacterized protein n=1 Tax=Solea senegalensis TaxID=28829 RepID=A0AAV6QR86_SOLSE|nr:hypothetical protein JOB18_033058 [Solea senegalensis]
MIILAFKDLGKRDRVCVQLQCSHQGPDKYSPWGLQECDHVTDSAGVDDKWYVTRLHQVHANTCKEVSQGHTRAEIV